MTARLSGWLFSILGTFGVDASHSTSQSWSPQRKSAMKWRHWASTKGQAKWELWHCWSDEITRPHHVASRILETAPALASLASRAILTIAFHWIPSWSTIATNQLRQPGRDWMEVYHSMIRLVDRACYRSSHRANLTIWIGTAQIGSIWDFLRWIK